MEGRREGGGRRRVEGGREEEGTESLRMGRTEGWREPQRVEDIGLPFKWGPVPGTRRQQRMP